ncbi:MAG: GTP cyclohydrolase I FolE [Cellvibrionaceae bacterium]
MMRHSLVESHIAHTPSLSTEAHIVRKALINAGLETPMINTNLSSEQKVDSILSSMTDIMYALGLDLNDDSLKDTPHRIAKMYVNEIFSGLDYASFPKITCIENKMQADEPVKVSGIGLTSTCEHHFVTIDGMAKVTYKPKDRVVGLSKINRVVQFFAQRPQVQERLTKQIMVALQALLGTDDVGVHIVATHYCVKARGVKDSHSETTTTAMGGCFKTDPIARSEFMS